MRSSKSRSRSKANRPRTLGNIINRVFDSSGPEGKVRGTPQQIIEKYQTLARDAQLSNDRVAAENFLQHAEHYTRLLAEAMREMAAEQEARISQQGGGQQGWQNRQNDPRDGSNRPDLGDGDQPYAALDSVDGDAPLVDLPEQDRAAARHFQPRPPRQNDERRQNNRPRDLNNRDTNNRDNSNRDHANKEGGNRDQAPREERRPSPAPQLRFEDGAGQDAPKPMPVFESPAALVAQVVQIQPEPTSEKPAPKPRAPRAKRVEAAPEVEGSQES